MTQNEKNLLMRELCARLPYHVFIEWDAGYAWLSIDRFKSVVSNEFGDNWKRPYLRPLSSMTEEEKEELLAIIGKESDIVCKQLKNNDCGIKEGKYHFNSLLELEFLLSRHFDFRGLIPRGLALEAYDGMYEIK